jgi:hypothetical protein
MADLSRTASRPCTSPISNVSHPRAESGNLVKSRSYTLTLGRRRIAPRKACLRHALRLPLHNYYLSLAYSRSGDFKKAAYFTLL